MKNVRNHFQTIFRRKFLNSSHQNSHASAASCKVSPIKYLRLKNLTPRHIRSLVIAAAAASGEKGSRAKRSRLGLDSCTHAATAAAAAAISRASKQVSPLADKNRETIIYVCRYIYIGDTIACALAYTYWYIYIYTSFSIMPDTMRRLSRK